MGTPCLSLCFRIRAGHSAETSQHRGLVEGDVIGLVALDFILRLVWGGTVNVTFVIDGSSMHFDDFSAHPPGFRIPAHVIANLERLDHGLCPGRVSIKKLPTEAVFLFNEEEVLAPPWRLPCRVLWRDR